MAVVEVTEIVLQLLELVDHRINALDPAARRVQDVPKALGIDACAMRRFGVLDRVNLSQVVFELTGESSDTPSHDRRPSLRLMMMIETDDRPVSAQTPLEFFHGRIETLLEDLGERRVRQAASLFHQTQQPVDTGRLVREDARGLLAGPRDVDLLIPALTGGAGDFAQPSPNLPADTTTKLRPVYTKTGAKTPQTNAEIMQRLGVFGMVESCRCLAQRLDQGECDEANGFFRGKLEQIAGQCHQHAFAFGSRLVQQFERVRPFVLQEAGNTPELGEWLDGARRSCGSHVRWLPAE